VAKPRANYSESRLARNLVERGLVLGESLESLFQSCSESGGLLAEALVKGGFLSDWELSQVASEVFNLPFLPVDVHSPADEALVGVDPEFLKRWCLVPLTRNDDLLTVAIPGSISPQAHDELCAMVNGQLAIVIGTVLSNRLWLETKFP
jgi:hypothetical protein